MSRPTFDPEVVSWLESLVANAAKAYLSKPEMNKRTAWLTTRQILQDYITIAEVPHSNEDPNTELDDDYRDDGYLDYPFRDDGYLDYPF